MALSQTVGKNIAKRVLGLMFLTK